MTVPENLYRSELVSFPGPWSFTIGKSDLILVRDQDLIDLCDPDRVVDLTLTYETRRQSLRQVCEQAQARGQRTLIVSYDHFFAQYRPGQSEPRRLMPDSDEYIERLAIIARFAAGYGLGLELSLLSPLEIGPAYARQTGEGGVWMHPRKGLRDPLTGAFSVELWQQQRWVNNKGVVALDDAGVRVFAFREQRIPGTTYRAIDPATIQDVSEQAHVERYDGLTETGGGYRATRIRVYGQGQTSRATSGSDLNRVCVVQLYRTPEMDYFSDKALPFLTGLLDRYVDAGISLNALYSDEMHIQQDWGYFRHHDHGEFAPRYVSPGLAAAFARTFGDDYVDLARYMIYFVSGQDDFSNDLTAKTGISHVFGLTMTDIQETALFRSRYYRLLQDGVVDLFIQAKRHIEGRIGYSLETRAHATWAESPTCDYWQHGLENEYPHHYEYTSEFLWSNTVHQAASACHDYFKWGDYLTGTGNDHAECGWLDRNYVGLALACSTGIVNEVPYSYAAHWGMPREIARRRDDLVNAYGAAGSPLFGAVQEMQHRDVAVLMLYPLDLVAVDPRFGSWMTQYGYANLITPAKLLERGTVGDGHIELAGRTFTTLIALFEPFPSVRLLAMMQQLAATGGRVIWSGPPPLWTAEGTLALTTWEELCGCRSTEHQGRTASGMRVVFEGELDSVQPQTILTGLLVDRIYPVTPDRQTHVVARVKSSCVGTHRALPSGGSVTYLGYRPRDDQSASLGYEARNWFEILSTLGAYPGSGCFSANDNTEHLSRTTDYLWCRFPNGAISVAPHLRHITECWPGGFARDDEQDAALLASLRLPTRSLTLHRAHVQGRIVSYAGEGAMAFRCDTQGRLIAFVGSASTSITIDEHTTVFASAPMGTVVWTPVSATCRVAGGAILQLQATSPGQLHIPVGWLPDGLTLVVEGARPGSRGEHVPSTRDSDLLSVNITPELASRWIYGVFS